MRMRAEVAIGGIAAPLPSKTTTSGLSDAARRAPSRTFEANGAPAIPPPARRQPTVGTPASAAVSRWSDAACRPERESATSSASFGGVSISSGSAGPPRPIATTTTRRSRASNRATWPVTAVFPTRLPVPITAIDGSSNGWNVGGSKRKSAPTYGMPSARKRDASASRSSGVSTGSSERSTTISAVARLLDDRDAVVRLAAQLLGAADEHDADELVGQLVERLTDDLGIVLPVDDRNGSHRFDVTSPSIRAVYFSYVFVSVEN